MGVTAVQLYQSLFSQAWLLPTSQTGARDSGGLQNWGPTLSRGLPPHQELKMSLDNITHPIWSLGFLIPQPSTTPLGADYKRRGTWAGRCCRRDTLCPLGAKEIEKEARMNLASIEPLRKSLFYPCTQTGKGEGVSSYLMGGGSQLNKNKKKAFRCFWNEKKNGWQSQSDASLALN